MENYLTQITNYLLTQSWQIVVLVVVISAVTLALKNKSAHVRYLLWLVVLAKCLVPPLLAIPLPILPQVQTPGPTLISNIEIPPANVEMADTVTSEPLALPSLPVTSPTTMERLARATARQWLGFGWIVGVAAFLLFALVKALRTDFWLWRQRRPLPAEAQTGIEKLFSGLDLKTFPKVWLVEGIVQPFVWGLLRGSIYLPANFVKVNSAEHHRDILGHELSHVIRFDAAVNILQIIAQAVFWFHLFVWWANKRIRAEREKCCDEMAIARLGAKAKDYSAAIVDTLIVEHESTRPVPSLAVAGPVNNIEERIKTMMKPGKKFYERPSLVAATVVLLLALLTVPTGLVVTARAEKKAAPEREEDLARELMRHRRELQEGERHIEHELEGLRDDQDEEALKLQAELRGIREKLRDIERELRDPERERREVIGQERREVWAREFKRQRRELQERARQIEHELEGLRDDQDEEARELQVELREIREKLRHIERELGGPERERQPDPERRSERERRTDPERQPERADERQLLRRLLERLERMEREIRVLHEEIARLKWQLREKKVVNKRDVEPDRARPRLKYRPLPNAITYFKGYLVGTITSMDEKGIMLKVTGVTAGEGNRADNPEYMKGENMRLLFYCFMGKDGKYHPDRSLVRAVNELRENVGLITAKVYAERDEALLLTRVWAGDQKDPERRP